MPTFNSFSQEEIVDLRTVSGTCMIAMILAFFSGCNSRTAEAIPAPVDIKAQHEVLVTAPGLVEPASEEFKVGSELSGKIRSVPVEEGAHVQAGQIIATLDNADFQARLASAEAEVQQKQAALQRLIAGARTEERRIAKLQVEESGAVLRNAELELKRREQLYKAGDVSIEDFERAQRDYRVAAARNDQAIQNNTLINDDPRADDVAKAQAEVSAASARVLEARALLDKTVIRSPISGVVLRKHLKPGESVVPAAANPVVTLGDTTGLRVRVDVDEGDIGRIRVGQRAYVSAPAFGEQKFWGRVVRISQMLGKKNIRTEEPTERIDTKILETLVELEDEHMLPTGLRVNSYIIVKDGRKD
jgi:HlyD family secretion protein